MAALEDAGLIAAPHTSAGRIPTDAGYRAFVDRLSALKPMSRAERAAIAQFLDGADELDEVLDRTVRLLSTLTRQVAVVQYPSLTRSTVRHVELVPDEHEPAASSSHHDAPAASSSASSITDPTTAAPPVPTSSPPRGPRSTPPPRRAYRLAEAVGRAAHARRRPAAPARA
jgi:hypothetical protein